MKDQLESVILNEVKNLVLQDALPLRTIRTVYARSEILHFVQNDTGRWVLDNAHRVLFPTLLC